MSKWLLWVLTLLLVMVGGPMIALAVEPNASMLICLCLFFLLAPLCVLYSGIFAGLDIRRRWWMPLVAVALFVISSWWLLSMDAQGLWVYGGLYATIGMVSMGGCAFGCRRKASQKDAPFEKRK